jgi:hypothetical protein
VAFSLTNIYTYLARYSAGTPALGRRLIMLKHKHFTLDDRITIQNLLKASYSFKAIGRELNKDCTFVSKGRSRTTSFSGNLGDMEGHLIIVYIAGIVLIRIFASILIATRNSVSFALNVLLYVKTLRWKNVPY